MLQPLAIRQEPPPQQPFSELQSALRELRQLLEDARPVRFPVRVSDGWLFLDIKKVTHFEVSQEVVYAWAGHRFRTSWSTLLEVEAAFPREEFLRIQRHLLIRPDAILGFRMTWGGRGEARLAGGIDLEVSRGSVPRLKERLGLSRIEPDEPGTP